MTQLFRIREERRVASRPEPSWRRERADLRQRDRRRDDDDANGTAAPVKGAGDANIVVECTSEYEEYGPAEGRGRPCARKLVDDEMVATRCARWSRQSSPDIYCAFFFVPLLFFLLLPLTLLLLLFHLLILTPRPLPAKFCVSRFYLIPFVRDFLLCVCVPVCVCVCVCVF